MHHQPIHLRPPKIITPLSANIVHEPIHHKLPKYHSPSELDGDSGGEISFSEAKPLLANTLGIIALSLSESVRVVECPSAN